MANIISFPHSKEKPSDAGADSSKDSVHVFFSAAEDRTFCDMLYEWPCFFNLDQDLNLAEIVLLYNEDGLSLAQECALEFMFHMHDPSNRFDIVSSLYAWGTDDREFFLITVAMHAELIEKIQGEGDEEGDNDE